MSGSPGHRRGVLGLVLALAAGGCFGDWVSARSRPRREEPPASDSAPSALDSSAEPETIADPCPTYLAAVAEHCGEILDGHPHDHGCHPEVVRVMALFQRRPEPPADLTSDQARDETCARYLRAMPERRDDPPAAVELGPHCRAWAERVRERCVTPLGSLPPALDGCGADLLGFESALGGITFGRAADYEPMCRDAVARHGEP